MRYLSATVVALAVLALTACSPTPTEPAATTATPSETKPVATAVSSPTPTPTRSAEAGCASYPGSSADDHGDIGTAAAAANLPSPVVLNGTQVVGSTDDPGRVEVVARVCSPGIDRAALVASANEIAKAIYASPARESVTRLVVSAWKPSGKYLDRDPVGGSVSTDYELFLWTSTAPSLDSNWT